MFNRVRVPAELKPTPPHVLEEYVRVRITQFVNLLSQRLGHYTPGLAKESFERAAGEVLAYLPPGDHGQLSLEDKPLQLVFRHDCLALGCLDPQCALCTHNPSRRCTVNFDRKYLVNDVLKARCGAGIRVELIDPQTGQPLEEKLPDITLQISVLDGNLYDNKFLDSGKYEGGTEPAEELDACALLQNKKKSTALLVCGSGGSNDAAGYVLLTMTDGKVPLNDLHVTDSSEAILSGRKPPFRLLVRALLPPGGPRLNIRHAVSEGFVVATRRTRTAGKADIPSVDDPVSKLEHMGKETVKKLADLASAAEQAGVEIDIPENCVQKVGEFKMLALRADQDGHLRQKLQHVLKLSKEKWDEARDHAMRAVVADNRMRAWYADRRSCELGVLFLARMGNVDLERPVGLLQTRMENGERKTEAIPVAQLNPNQREMLRNMKPQAAAAWWAPGHAGWAIFPMDSDAFLQTGTLSVAHAAAITTLGAGAVPTATTVTATDAPSSPTTSAVSLSTMPQQRRHTTGSGGGAAAAATNGLSAGASQSAEVLLHPDVKQPLLQPAVPSAPVTFPSAAPPPPNPFHGLSNGLASAGAGGLPSAFGGSLPTAFGGGMGSGRSSRAGSVTDSPPPSQRMASLLPTQPHPPGHSLSLHHSLPQPPTSQPSLQQFPSVHTQPSVHSGGSLQHSISLQGHPSVQQQQQQAPQLPSYPSQVSMGLQGRPSLPHHPSLSRNPSLQHHTSLQAHASLQGHPNSLQHQHSGLQGHPSLQQHSSLQAHSSLQQHPSVHNGGQAAGGLQQHPSLQRHPSLQHLGKAAVPAASGGSFSGPNPFASAAPNLDDGPPAAVGHLQNGTGPQPLPHQHHQQASPPSGVPSHHLMPPPPPPAMVAARTMMPPPSGPPPSFRMGPPPPGALAAPQPLHHQGPHPGHYRGTHGDAYPPGGQVTVHSGGHTHVPYHMGGQPRMNGFAPHLQHPPEGHMQHYIGAPLTRPQLSAPPGPAAPGASGPGTACGGQEPPLLQPADMRMTASASFDLRSPHHHQRPPPAPFTVAGALEEDFGGNLQTRGSANPRPHKMPSLRREGDGPVADGGDKPDFLSSSAASVAAAAAAAVAAANGPSVVDAKATAAPTSAMKDEEAFERPGAVAGPATTTSSHPSPPQQLPSVPGTGVPPGPRAPPPVPGQLPPGASAQAPAGPPPNPFARVQSNRMVGPVIGPGSDSDDSDPDDSLAMLAALPSLPLTNSMIQAVAGGAAAAAGGGSAQRPTSNGGAGANGPNAGGGGAGGGGPSGATNGAGQGNSSGLGAPLPSLQMLDSQALDMVLGDNMILETSSLNTGMSYGLFLPPALAMADGGPGLLAGTQSKELLRSTPSGLLRPTTSGLLKPTSSGLDTMASMELALPGVRKAEQQAAAGQHEQRGDGDASADKQASGGSNAAGVSAASRPLGPYAR